MAALAWEALGQWAEDVVRVERHAARWRQERNEGEYAMHPRDLKGILKMFGS